MRQRLLLVMIVFVLTCGAVSADGTARSGYEALRWGERIRADINPRGSLTEATTQAHEQLWIDRQRVATLLRSTKEDVLAVIDVARREFLSLQRFEAPSGIVDHAIGTFPIRSDGTLTAVVLLYLVNYGGMRVDDTATFLRVFVLDRERVVSASSEHEVGRTDALGYRGTGPEDVWVFRSFKDRNNPATKSGAAIYASDRNGDGLGDIVIWKLRSASRKVADEGQSDYVFEGESFEVMTFDATGSTYSDPQVEEGLSRPSNRLRAAQPKLGKGLPELKGIPDGER